MPSSRALPHPGLAPYVGGKRNLAPQIIRKIARIPHRTYAEPFMGMGGVFFRRPEPAPVEVVNDLSRDVDTFFRVLQRHYVAFLEMLRFQITCRREFERLVATDPATLTDLERAARFPSTCSARASVGRSWGGPSASPRRRRDAST